MTITSTPHTIDSVFVTRYFIDFYQRDYKWTQPQVESLLSDIFFKFEADYKPTNDASLSTIAGYSWYYLSTFVTNQEQENKFIVDGQQRLTTLTLIIVKLFHMANQHELVDQADWLKSKIYGAHAEGKTYWLGADGRAPALEALFSGGSPAELLATGNLPISIRNIYVNYDFISKQLEERLPTKHKLHAFILYFMRRIQLVELHINDAKDVAMVFEVINDRGERLRPYEVFKGELLGQIEKREVDERYLNIWKSSIDPLQDTDPKEPDRFFQLLFRSKYVNSRAEYSEFEGDYQRTVFSSKWDEKLQLKRNPVGVKHFLTQQVEYYSRLYRDLVEQTHRSGTYLYFNGTLNEHDRQYLLIMSAISNNDPERDRKIELVARLFDRNFSLLQLTGSYNTNRFTESIIELNSKIRDQLPGEIQGYFDKQLLQDILAVKGVTTDDPFQWSLFRNVGYESGSRFLRYFFARVEHYIGQHAGMNVDDYWSLVRNNGNVYGYHVEHILADNEESRQAFAGDEEQYVQQRNRLGALLLLRNRDNIASSNEPYFQKLRTYSHATRIAGSLVPDFYHNNPGFRDFVRTCDLPFRPMSTFGIAEIEERQRLYFALAKRIWGDTSFPLQVSGD